jgi:hypothetical protein
MTPEEKLECLTAFYKMNVPFHHKMLSWISPNDNELVHAIFTMRVKEIAVPPPRVEFTMQLWRVRKDDVWRDTMAAWGDPSRKNILFPELSSYHKSWKLLSIHTAREEWDETVKNLYDAQEPFLVVKDAEVRMVATPSPTANKEVHTRVGYSGIFMRKGNSYYQESTMEWLVKKTIKEQR